MSSKLTSRGYFHLWENALHGGKKAEVALSSTASPSLHSANHSPLPTAAFPCRNSVWGHGAETCEADPAARTVRLHRERHRLLRGLQGHLHSSLPSPFSFFFPIFLSFSFCLLLSLSSLLFPFFFFPLQLRLINGSFLPGNLKALFQPSLGLVPVLHCGCSVTPICSRLRKKRKAPV